ncbi:MAG TPA: hypothetical protein VFY21_10485, partial [Xanthobacteraceae bacterium]|nr:hypothetical protein [Xanthobacteraceae bacterium]
DLALDTFPYNGHTNTNDLLWMGVPIVTTAGRSFAARAAGSILTAHGFAELATASLAEYEVLASALARDPIRLAAMRERMRLGRERSSLFDTPRYCAQLEAAYRIMYERWRAGEAPAPIHVEPV